MLKRLVSTIKTLAAITRKKQTFDIIKENKIDEREGNIFNRKSKITLMIDDNCSAYVPPKCKKKYLRQRVK